MGQSNSKIHSDEVPTLVLSDGANSAEILNLFPNIEPQSNRDWLTLSEVAAALRSSISHVKTLLGQRGGPILISYFKHGKRTLVTKSALEKYKRQVEALSVTESPRRRRSS